MKNAGLVTVIVALCCGCSVLGAQEGIGDLALRGCSAARNGRSDKASVAALINKLADPGVEPLKPEEVGEFEFIDLAGDGRCELVMGVSSGPAVSFVWIYWQDHFQALMGLTDFKKGIRDLNGDGKKEIIVHSYLDLAGRRSAGSPTPEWPEVYRLQGEKYVPASKDFPAYYDSEVLPKLDKEIAEPRSPDQAAEYYYDAKIAALEMQRDKILRVLGRDPDAGLQEARRWAASDNPALISDAVDVFRDIPGHEAEVSAAEQAEKRALRYRHPDGSYPVY